MKKDFLIFLLPVMLVMLLLLSCQKDSPTDTPPTAQQPRLIFKFKFDSTQTRLDSFGQPSAVAAGNAAQNPQFNTISANYIELSPSAFTALGSGSVLYQAAQTNAGGSAAIDFDQSVVVGEGQIFKHFELSDLTAGTYNFVRVSLAYQNYDIAVHQSGLNFPATVASFIGFNTYINDYAINTQTLTINDDKLQGYWGVETNLFGNPYVVTGQAPQGATTVPNPLFFTSPVPAGSCVVTAQFDSPLVITGQETSDIVITLSLSTNHSFEWTEVTADGLYEPSAGENVVDMGIRGMLPIVEQ
jgi:hypothetical protein